MTVTGIDPHMKTHTAVAVDAATTRLRHVSGRAERALLAAGERVVRVPPKMMAGARASA